jgi:hypothetical protein
LELYVQLSFIILCSDASNPAIAVWLQSTRLVGHVAWVVTPGRAMQPFVPNVTDLDVERIVVRDFPPDARPSIRDAIRSVAVREKPRVIVACLKNSGGNYEKLAGELANASGYWREIISEAEYPNYSRKSGRIDRMSQYLEWFGNENDA